MRIVRFGIDTKKAGVIKEPAVIKQIELFFID